jgi:exonuclease SbcD
MPNTMFRFIHTADLHLDSPLRGLASRDGAPAEELRGASRRALDNLIDLAKAEGVDFVVIAGDIYDRDWKDYSTGLFFRSRMVRLQEAGIPVFMIAGNHDAASVISRKLGLPDNVTYFSSQAAETVEPPSWPVALHGMSFPNRAVDENLVPRYPSPVAGKFNIGILHTSLAGNAGHDTYAPCTVEELTAKGYDYWALGHIHQPAVVREKPWVVYPGNLQGRHARECGERGCRVVTVDDDLEVAACDWHILDVARWASVTVVLDGTDTVEELIRLTRENMGEAVNASGDRLLAVRVTFSGTTVLHGALCSHPDRLEAEVEACAQDFGEGRVWIERVKLETRPVASLADLAARDGLTKVVVEALDEAQAGTGDLPPEVRAMLDILPADLAEPMRTDWQGPGRQTLMEDACSMILERLTEKGAEP